VAGEGSALKRHRGAPRGPRGFGCGRLATGTRWAPFFQAARPARPFGVTHPKQSLRSDRPVRESATSDGPGSRSAIPCTGPATAIVATSIAGSAKKPQPDGGFFTHIEEGAGSIYPSCLQRGQPPCSANGASGWNQTTTFKARRGGPGGGRCATSGTFHLIHPGDLLPSTPLSPHSVTHLPPRHFCPLVHLQTKVFYSFPNGESTNHYKGRVFLRGPRTTTDPFLLRTAVSGPHGPQLFSRPSNNPPRWRCRTKLPRCGNRFRLVLKLGGKWPDWDSAMTASWRHGPQRQEKRKPNSHIFSPPAKFTGPRL